MADKITLDIVTPHGHVFTDQVDEIVTTGSEGEFGVLPDHIPFLTTLKVGMLTYKKGPETGIFFINGGYAEVGPDKVTILADSAERSEDIDVERAKAAMKRAEERLRQDEKANKIDHTRATAALDRALTRIHIVQSKTAK